MTTQTDNKSDYLYKLRHSAAHVLAEAVKDLFPDTKLTIGPPTEDGFYYDFDSPHRFVPEDLDAIEKKMRFNLRSNAKFVGKEISREDAVAGAVMDTRRYAKRQLTWFRNQMKDWIWADPGEALAAIRSHFQARF